MPSVPASRRLSPKVRRLLREHGLTARSVPGTGTGGRITPHDVLGSAGLPRSSGTARVLASPLARRLLRDAGVDLATAARANDGRRLTRADAERVIRDADRDTRGARAEQDSPIERTAATASEVEVDVAVLLADVAAGSREFLAHNGFELATEVALASSAAGVLAHHPELAVTAALRSSGEDASPGVHIGFPSGTGGADIAVVPDVHHLTVAGLARRARAAVARPAERGGTPAPASPAVIVAAETTAPEQLSTRAAIGLLTISRPTLHEVTGVDDLGHAVVHTRPHATIRLHHGDRTTADAAAAFLEEVGAAMTSWSLPVGP